MKLSPPPKKGCQGYDILEQFRIECTIFGGVPRFVGALALGQPHGIAPTIMSKSLQGERMMERKRADELAVDEEFEPLEFCVTEEFNENYLHAVEDFHPRYIEQAAERPPIVNPALFINFSNITRSPSFYLPADTSALHTHEEVEYINPGKVGATFTVSWKVVDAYERRGRPYQVVDALITDDAGTPILRRKTTNTFITGPQANS